MQIMKLILIALLLVSTSPARAQKSEGDIRAAIENEMNQRHPSLPAGFWESLGSDALPVLKKMYSETSNPNIKGFLIDGLSRFGDSDTGTFLESEVKSTQNDVLKKKLLGAVIQSQGENAFDFVEPYLQDESPHVRLAVASGLKSFEKNSSIQRRLVEFKSNEKTPWVLTDLNKVDPGVELQKTRIKINANPGKGQSESEGLKSIAEVSKPLAPLLEKDWAGIWRGTQISDKKISLVEANLILIDSGSTPKKWRVEFKMPKKLKQEWKTGEFTLNYFQTNRAHWIEIRNSKMDVVFLAQRKVN